MKIKEASVSSVFAWGSTPNHASSLVTGSVAGAMGDDFCADGHIELFSCDIHNSDAFLVRIGSAITYDRFTDIDWATFGPNEGLVAGALVDGTVLISDPTNIRDGIDRPISIIEAHSSKCRVVQFNPIQEHLLATAGEDREFRIWNLNNASEPLLTLDPTNPKNPHSSDIADLKWNPKYPHIIACATSAGSNHVWDLRAKRCTMNFQDGTKSVSSLAWHPEVPTQLVTATDDVRGTLHVWDLKKAVAPVRVMSNHSDGVLSLSWCTHDANLLLSCGRDGRTLCWNPNTGILNSELPRQENWVFRVRWSKMIPNLFATSCFDNTLNVYSLQGCISKNLTEDIFSSKQTSVDSAPKWLKRPAGAIFLQSGKILRYSKSRGAEISLANTELNAQFRELEKALQLFRLNRDECTLQAVLDKLEKQNLSSDRENLMIGIIFSMHLPSNLFDPKSTLNINIEQIKHHVTEVIQSDAECDLSQIHGLIHKCLISDLIEEASYLCLKIGNTEDALLIASYRDEAANELQKKVMHIILDRRKHLHYMNFIRSLMLADMHSMIESSIGFATWNELLYFTFLHKKKFDQKKFCEQLATFFSSKNELATEACLLYAQNVDKIISIWSDLVTERIRTMDDVVRRELMIQIYVHKIMSLEDLTQTICSHDVFSSSLIDHVRTLMIHGFKKEAMYIIQRYPHIKQFSKIANTHCSEIENSVNKSVCTSTGSHARNHPKTTNSSHKSTQNIDSTQKFSAPVPSTDGAMNTMKRAGASKVSDLPKSTSNEWTSVQKDLMTRLQDAANKISDKRKRESIEKALTVLSSNFDSQTLPGELIDILSRYSTCLGSPEARDIIKFLGSNYWDLFKPFMNIKFL